MNYTLKVSSINKETADTVTICFKQPALRKLKYLPGQYLTLTVNINNRKYKRPYSLSSSPNVDSTLNITVKRLFKGVVSNHLLDVVAEGDILEVSAPMGKFIWNDEMATGKDIFLWGAGSGITPLYSILKTALMVSSAKITLVYCNKSISETIFYNELKDLSKQYSDRLFVNIFCTKENAEGVRIGRISEKDIASLLENAGPLNQTAHYICGPAGLKEVVKTGLIKNGLQQDQIFSEDFEHIFDENELKDVQTQVVELVKNDKEITIEVVRGKTILQAALDAQIDLNYSCQTGTCTLCKAKLVNGEVKEVGRGELDDTINEDERLLCCCYPLTHNVKFKII